MPQFDIFFFLIFSFIVLFIYMYFFFVIFNSFFSSFFKIKKVSKNIVYQKALILSIKNEINFVQKARVSFIKKKLIEFYEEINKNGKI